MANTTIPVELSSTPGIVDNSNATAITIDSSENVGIGTATPGSFDAEANNLVVGSGSGDEGITIFSGSSVGDYGSIFFGDATGTPKQGQIRYEQNNEVMSFYTNTSEKMRIDLNGNLIVGHTSAGSPSGTATIRSKIQVGETEAVPASDNYNSFQAYNRGDSGVYSYVSNVTYNNHMLFLWRGSVAGSITSPNSASVAYNTSSDYRLKENVDYDFNALDRVAQLKPARFNFIVDADRTVDGFLAHEVQDIVPEAITGEKDAVDSDGNPEYQGIDQSKLVPLLTKAIQEQQTIIDDLKSRIEALEE